MPGGEVVEQLQALLERLGVIQEPSAVSHEPVGLVARRHHFDQGLLLGDARDHGHEEVGRAVDFHQFRRGVALRGGAGYI